MFCVRFEVFTAVNMKSGVFGDVMLCSMLWLPVTANIHSAPIFVTLIMEAIRSSETLALTRATRRNIQEDCILYGMLCLLKNQNLVCLQVKEKFAVSVMFLRGKAQSAHKADNLSFTCKLFV
jgi:hypothetical protein